MTNRRQFMTQVSLGGVLLLTKQAMADSAKVSESDPLPAAVGYKANGANVDKAKFPKYSESAKCSNCVMFQGKPGDAIGPCTLFGGKLVAADGWCNSWSKKT